MCFIHKSKCLLSIFLLSLLLTACGGGGGGGGADDDDSDGGGGGSTDPVENALNDLGVDTKPGPRNDAELEALPDDYSPLGASRSLTKISELMLANLTPSNGNFSSDFYYSKYSPANPPMPASSNTIHTPADSAWLNAQYRDVVAADIDADGLEETLIVYHDAGSGEIRLRMHDDETEAFQLMEWPISLETTTQLNMTAGDFDGDGREDIAVLIVQTSQALLLVLQGDKNVGYQSITNLTKIYSQENIGSTLSFELAAGNIDHDPAYELGVVKNEIISFNNNGNGVAYYYVYDDQKTNFQVLESSTISGNDGGIL